MRLRRLRRGDGSEPAADRGGPATADGAPRAPETARAPASRRRRDRHGRGLRGPLSPPDVPLTRSRADRFADLVLDAVERLERRWGNELADVEFAVETVPPLPGPGDPTPDGVPLSRLHPGAAGRDPRIVLYRRPIEARAAGRSDLAALVHDLIVEQVAELLGLDPAEVDPNYRLD